MNIKIGNELKKKCSCLNLGIVTCDVEYQKYNSELWNLINNVIKDIERLSLEEILNLNGIKQARDAYKSLGKDPSRYRLSSESLLRRIVKGKGLYKVNNIVDINNLVSIVSRNSIGVYDLDKISGDVIFKIGGKEIYEGIGRGIINIQNIPVLYDDIGPFGSPTSDSTRTMINEHTKRVLVNIISFNNGYKLNEYIDYLEELLKKYANAKKVKKLIID